jgi:hypothetical protein
MMMKAIVPMFVVACCTATLAQVPDPAKQAPKPMQGLTSGAVTVSGCVAEGTPAGHFMLNNAMVMPGAAKKEGTPAMPTTGEKSMAASYMLVGGENLKAHVGHKVEVTGTLGAPAKMEEKTATGAKEMKAPELRVQSVKMVSTTCP